MAGKSRDCIPKRPCPYDDCECTEVWYWGWFDGREECIPLVTGSGVEAASAIPLRRFMCTACKRTFSWRPPFLLFGRRYPALFYQLAFKDWAFGNSGCGKRTLWWDLGPLTRRAFFGFLERRRTELLRRLGHPTGVASFSETWHWCRRFILDRGWSQSGPPPLSIHLICFALASHPRAARYSLRSL